MDVKEAMDQRISLRAYDQKPIEQEKLSQLQEAIDVANTQMAEKRLITPQSLPSRVLTLKTALPFT